MLATSALGSPGVCVYNWANGNLQAASQLTHFGDAGATSAVINCNNQVIASANEGGEVKLSLPESGKVSLYEFTVEKDREVRSLSFDATSRYLACGGDFENIFIWDLKKKKKVRELIGHSPSDNINSVIFSNDGQTIASGGSSGIIILHSVRERHISGQLKLDQQINITQNEVPSSVGQVSFCPLANNILGSAYAKGEVAIFDTLTSQPIHVWKMHSQNPNPSFGSSTIHAGRYGSISFSPINQKFFASGGEDGKLIFTDYETKKKVKTLDLNLGPITATHFIDGIYIAAGTSKGVMMLYDLRNSSEHVQQFQDHASLPVNSMHFHEISPEVLLTAPGSKYSSESARASTGGNRFRDEDTRSLASMTDRGSISSIRSSLNPEMMREAAQVSSSSTLRIAPVTNDSPHFTPNQNQTVNSSSSVTSPSSTTSSSTSPRALSSPGGRPNTPPIVAPDSSMRRANSGYLAPSASDVMLGLSPSIGSMKENPTSSKPILVASLPTPPPHSEVPSIRSKYPPAPAALASVLPLTSTPNPNLTPPQDLPEPSPQTQPRAPQFEPPTPDTFVPPSHATNTIGINTVGTSKLSSSPSSFQTSIGRSVAEAAAIAVAKAAPPPATSSSSLMESVLNAHSAASSNATISTSAASSSTQLLNQQSSRLTERFDKKLVEECLNEAMDDMRREVRKDIQGLHLDMINQFEEQQQTITSILDDYTQRLASLVHENESLRRENEELRKLY